MFVCVRCVFLAKGEYIRFESRLVDGVSRP